MTRVVLVAGGTGGHVFPALATAEALKLAGAELMLLTDRRGKRYLGEEDIPHMVMSASTPTGSSGMSKLKALFWVAFAVLTAMLFLLRHRPDVLVGFGGYPAFAPCKAAQLLSIPVVLHEQNAIFGRANRRLAAGAKAVALSFAKTRGLPEGVTAHVVGNPVRPTPDVARPMDAMRRVTIFAGSQGASFFGPELTKALMPLFLERKDNLEIWHQVRQEDLDEVQKLYLNAGVHATVAVFFKDLPQRLKITDVAIARAGASTVAELTLFGVASVFVPLPGGLDAQQSINAEALVAQAGAFMVDQHDFDEQKLLGHIRKLLEEPSHLQEVRAAMKDMAKPHAGSELSDLILSQVGERE